MGAQSLANQRIGIEVSGRNIANVNTPNAARQRINIRSDLSLSTEVGQQGTGSVVIGIESLRSKLLDGQVAHQMSLSGFCNTKQDYLSLIQDAMGERLTSASSVSNVSSSTGISNSLNMFFSAWEAVANNPNSTIARNELLSKADILASDIKSSYGRLLDLKNGLFVEADGIASQVNSLSQQISDLNAQIARVEVGNNVKANDLRDQRQECIEQLSKYVNVTVKPHVSTSDSMVDIYLEDDANVMLVNGAYGAGAGTGLDASYRMDVASLNPETGNIDANNTYNRATNSAMRAVFTNSTQKPAFTEGNPIPDGSLAIDVKSGQLGAALDTSNNIIGFGHQPPDNGATLATNSNSLVYQMNQFAVNLVNKVNSLHTTNTWDQNGNPGVDFFETGGNALNISLNSALKNHPELIAAAQGSEFSGVLNGSAARAIADLRDDSSLGTAYRQTVANLGTATQQATRNATSQQMIQNQLLRQRDSVSGISLDEEVVNLAMFHRAFEATARFITVIDEMLRKVINLGR